jgi:hypothetical protein
MTTAQASPGSHGRGLLANADRRRRGVDAATIERLAGPMTRVDRVATLKEAKAQFQKSWDARRRGRGWKKCRANHDKFLG